MSILSLAIRFLVGLWSGGAVSLVVQLIQQHVKILEAIQQKRGVPPTRVILRKQARSVLRPKDRLPAKAGELPRGLAILRSPFASLWLPQDDSLRGLRSCFLKDDPRGVGDDIRPHESDGAGRPAPRLYGMITHAAETLFVDLVATPLGTMVGAATHDDLMLLEFIERCPVPTTSLRLGDCDFDCVASDSPVLQSLRTQLDEYFNGRRARFELSLRTPGTDFQQRVWTQLQTIPPGTTTTYTAVAKAIGRPTAVRAVAGANGDNRIAIVIPCHRVIGADGTLTGYGGGLWRKRRLLDLEAGALSLA